MPDLEVQWRDEAACASALDLNPDMAKPNAWLREENFFVDTVKRICGDCPVRLLCLKDAIDDKEAEGWRAGFYFDEGYLTPADNRAMNSVYHLTARTRRRPGHSLNK